MRLSILSCFLTLGTTLLLSACAGDYAFKSNLDGEAIEEYFKAGDVTLYEDGQLPDGNYTNLGLVEGGACQESTSTPPALIADARTEARKKAANLGGNGLIVKRCVLVEEADPTCVTRAICVGQTIKTLSDSK